MNWRNRFGLREAKATTQLALMLLMVAAVGTGCRREPSLSDDAYRQAVVAFYTGLAAMETSQDALARQQFDRVTTIAEREPAGWANLGLLLMRQQELDAAAERLKKAAELAPDNADIERLQGLAESRRGNLAEATAHWKRALSLRPTDAKAAYALALDLERQGTPEALQQAQQTLETLATRTGNTVAQIEYVRLAAKRGDGAAVRRGVDLLAAASAAWPADIQERFATVQQTAGANPRAVGPTIAFLKNVLMRLPEYRRWLAALSTPREEVGEPIERFLVLPNPSPKPAAPDEAISFAVKPRPDSGMHWIGAIVTGPDAPPAIAGFDGRILTIDGRPVWTTASRAMPTSAAQRPGEPSPLPNAERRSRHTVLAADLNYDFRTDLVVSAGGLVFLRQQPDGSFKDVTATTRLPREALVAPNANLWAADVDTDGDLDIVVATADQPVRVLRNNGDDTFAVQQPFGNATNVRDFAWGDLDGDGVPDAALLAADGTLRVFINARGGSFRQRAVPSAFPKAVAIAAAEVNGDSLLDVIAIVGDGSLVALVQDPAGNPAVDRVGNVGPLTGAPRPGEGGLLVADLDNNGAADVIVAGSGTQSRVLLRGPDGSAPLKTAAPLDARAAADLDGDGRVDLVGVSDHGAAIATSHGRRNYGWQTLRPHAATVTGDQRINSFGIGGEVELRTGLHVQRQPIASPLVHFGLGEARSSEVVRIVWPNGMLQSEFNVPVRQTIAATQRLKGSCPWLFAWNGREISFVTDVLWRSPLGLRINAQKTADVLMTEDWVRVRGDQLQPRNGMYDLRITAELWETHFFDLASLLVVDHPAGTEVFVDERFSVPAPKLAVTVTAPVEPMATAVNDAGQDVMAVVRSNDDRYLDIGARGRYQGVATDHFVELELPATAPRTGPLWLVAQGWIHPTDSSINVALSQGSLAPPRGLRLEVADGRGGFRTAQPNVGFPAGKYKSVLIDLTNAFVPGAPRRLRLATNMEIYWDRLGWAAGRPDVTPSIRRLPLTSAELRYRGYSRVEQQDASSPERPRYILDGTTPRWRDLEGYYTRFGDVRDLLTAVDDRYVIMNAGDELQVRFPEAPPAGAATVRDFVMITDGWEKDGDFNTTFSRTVLPLPTHASAAYDRPPGRLEDDPVYQRHRDDFVNYHTRYVTPDAVRDALLAGRDQGR